MKGSNRRVILSLIVIAFFTNNNNAAAKEKIAVLDFELNDITSLPNTPEELIRTTSIKPLLERAISESSEYEIVHFDLKAQQSANAGFGYLFRFPDEAAKLAKKWRADWVIVGQHSKPSFLESSLIVEVVKVKTGLQTTEIVVDLKGNHNKVTERATKELAKRIKSSLSVSR